MIHFKNRGVKETADSLIAPNNVRLKLGENTGEPGSTGCRAENKSSCEFTRLEKFNLLN